jgi:16S rRNA (guanine1516-N2)-methyltransferase
MKPTIAITSIPERKIDAQKLAWQLGLNVVDYSSVDYEFLLAFTTTHLELRWIAEPSFAPISVDFLQGKLAHRRQYGGGKGQLLARAVGIKKGLKNNKPLKIMDATAGLGQDAFVLASLGCEVQMIERSPVIAALLQDGLERAQIDTSMQDLSLSLIIGDALGVIQALSPASFPDVIYLDPMYPSRTKSALVKKEMRFLRALVGADIDAEKLLTLSLTRVKKRVVVKRARYAPTLSALQPDLVLNGKSSRFDIYFASFLCS